MIHDIHISFDNLAHQNTGLQVKRGDYNTHILNFLFDDIGADSYRIRIKNANGETSESITLDTPSYQLSAFDVSCSGLVNAELSAYISDSRLTSATFTYEVLNDISTDRQMIEDDRYPILDEMIKKVCDVENEMYSKYVTNEQLEQLIQTAIYDSWEDAV